MLADCGSDARPQPTRSAQRVMSLLADTALAAGGPQLSGRARHQVKRPCADSGASRSGALAEQRHTRQLFGASDWSNHGRVVSVLAGRAVKMSDCSTQRQRGTAGRVGYAARIQQPRPR